MMSLQVERWGDDGDAIVCVHGSLSAGEAAFAAQRPLADRFRLVVPYRRGYGDNPPVERVDVGVDADDVAALLGDGAHLVGTSMGGVVSMIAAARAPERVVSLTLIEPPAFALARDVPAVRRVSAALAAFYRDAPCDDVEAFCAGFLGALGLDVQLPSPFPAALARAARNVMTERPWRLDVPVGALADATFPKLVVSGNWSPAFEAVADRLAALLGAERRTFDGAGHAVQRLGEPFNEVLVDFVARATRDADIRRRMESA